MKVDFLLTIRIEPETKGDAVERMAPVYHQMREEIESKLAEGCAITIPPTTDIRWLLISKRFD